MIGIGLRLGVVLALRLGLVVKPGHILAFRFWLGLGLEHELGLLVGRERC